MSTWREKERELREEAIITAAEKLFYGKGFDQASMDEVAAQAGFTKRTVYQYFPGKQDLYYAVVLRGMRRLLKSVRDAGEAKNGLEKLREKKLASWRCARENAEAFAVMSQKRLVSSGGENSEYELKIAQIGDELFSLFRETLEECQSSGEMPPPGNATEQGASFFIFIGTLARLADVGDAYASQFGTDAETFALKVLELTDRLLIPWS